MKLIIESWRNFVNEEVETEEQAAQWLAQQIAPLIDAADAGNFMQPLAQLVARLNSAEGASPMVRALLKVGDADGDAQDEVIQVTTANIPAPQLIPTQGVIDLFKSVGFNGSVADSLKSVIAGTSGAPPILAAGNGGQYYIIDGHHRWSGATVFNTNCKIPANVIVMDPGKALLISQLSIAAYVGAGKKLPSASAKQGRSIIGPGAMEPKAVYKILKENVGQVIDPNAGSPFWNAEVQQVVKATGYGGGSADGGLQQVSKNCGKLAKAYAKEGPPREIMPQFDPEKGGPDFKTVEPEFTGGKLNYQPSYARKKAAE